MTKQRIALVTGANRGIGREVARQLAEQNGFLVLLGSRDFAKGQNASNDIGHGSMPIQLDVTDQRSISDAFQHIDAQFGRLDVLVNNAGVDYDTDQHVQTADLSRVRRAFETNLFGPWATTQAATQLLKRSDEPRIVNVSSGAGALKTMSSGVPGYGISKAALNALTLKAAAELKVDGILVNAVCPGWVATDMGGGGRSIPDGARGVVWAATLPNNGPTGGFFRDGNAIDW